VVVFIERKELGHVDGRDFGVGGGSFQEFEALGFVYL
jgi:hypothetical protein